MEGSPPWTATPAGCIYTRSLTRRGTAPWVIDGHGQPFLLEANPNGQWLFLDSLWEGKIAESLAKGLEDLPRSASGSG